MSKTIRSINLSVENVGKVVKFSKKRFAWTLRVNGTEFLVEYTRSSMSGKDRVIINGVVLYEKKEMFRDDLNLKLSFEGCIFSVVERDSKFKLFIDGKDFDELYGHDRVKSILKKNKREEEQEKLTLSQVQLQFLNPKPQAPPTDHNQEAKKCVKKVHFNLEKNTVRLAPHLSYASDNGDSQLQAGQFGDRRIQTCFDPLSFPPVMPVQVLENSDIQDDPPPFSFASQLEGAQGNPIHSSNHWGQSRLPVEASRFEQPQHLPQTGQTVQKASLTHSDSLNSNLFDSMDEDTGNPHPTPQDSHRSTDADRGWHTDRPAPSRAFLSTFHPTHSPDASSAYHSRLQPGEPQSQPSNHPTGHRLDSGWTGPSLFGSFVSQNQPGELSTTQQHWQPAPDRSSLPVRTQPSPHHTATAFSSAVNPGNPLQSGFGHSRLSNLTDAGFSPSFHPGFRDPGSFLPPADLRSHHHHSQTSAQFYNGPNSHLQESRAAFPVPTSSGYAQNRDAPYPSLQSNQQPIYEPTALSGTLFDSQRFSQQQQPADPRFSAEVWQASASNQQQAESAWTFGPR